MTKITTIILDLDGTLLNTLDDLAVSTNHALSNFGLPKRTIDEVRQFVGNGVRLLIERAVPKETPKNIIDAVFATFKAHYAENCMVHTGLYNGVAEMLIQLKEAGYKMAIVSNKIQSGVDELYRNFFAETVTVAVGEREGVARKPAPDMIEIALKELGSTKQETVYVGDSDVDIATAANSGLPCISVLWGFRDREFLVEHGAEIFAERPTDILPILQKMG